MEPRHPLPLGGDRLLRGGGRGAPHPLLIAALLGCSQPPAPAPESAPQAIANTPASPPAAPADPDRPGAITFLHESGCGEDDPGPCTWEIRRLTLGSNSSPVSLDTRAIPGRPYPGPPDPRGEAALIVSVERPGQVESLWLLPLDGSPVPLGPAAVSARDPAWSPDGAWIYLSALYPRPSGPPSAADRPPIRSPDLYRISRDGGPPARLTAAPGGSYEPAISPGGRLAMGSSRSGGADIWIAQADGADPRRLTDHPADDTRPRWRGDDQIVWISRRSGQAQVWISPASPLPAPRPLRAIVPDHQDLDVILSPDGQIAAITVQTGPAEIDLHLYDLRPLDADPPGPAILLAKLDAPGPDEHPAFSPDGQRIAFTSSRAGSPDLWLYRYDNADLQPLTSGDGADWLARWSR